MSLSIELREYKIILYLILFEELMVLISLETAFEILNEVGESSEGLVVEE